jgi:hypothetical protein
MGDLSWRTSDTGLLSKRVVTKIHTVHPGLVLPVAGLCVWRATALLVLTAPDKPILPDQVIGKIYGDTTGAAPSAAPATPRPEARAFEFLEQAPWSQLRSGH